MSSSLNLGSISTRRERIARLAREDLERSFLSLAHYIDEYWLREAYARTRKDGAPGVDGQTAAEYAENLEENLRDLLRRFKSGLYRAPAVRRSSIPKGGDRRSLRPIGIPTFEDKILQRAVAMVLESIYEQDFLSFSYGFRPGRSAHQALESLWQGLRSVGGGVLIELDIESFYDTLDHGHLREFLDRRVRDGVLRRTINKWLKAGVMEEGRLIHPTSGTPQGGVVSPILSNIYLHEVLDRWFVEQVQPRMRGRSFLIRFADDAVLVFEQAEDARRVEAVLAKRFHRFGLRLHPTKTRRVSFRRPPGRPDDRSWHGPKPETFEFLGFTHYWGRSRKGWWVVKRKTAASRLSRALREIGDWCREHRHRPVSWQHQRLCWKLQGHNNYYGVSNNSRALGNFRYWTERIWRKWLDRRSQKARMKWKRFQRLLERYPLPRPRIVHRYQSA